MELYAGGRRQTRRQTPALVAASKGQKPLRTCSNLCQGTFRTIVQGYSRRKAPGSAGLHRLFGRKPIIVDILHIDSLNAKFLQSVQRGLQSRKVCRNPVTLAGAKHPLLTANRRN